MVRQRLPSIAMHRFMQSRYVQTDREQMLKKGYLQDLSERTFCLQELDQMSDL